MRETVNPAPTPAPDAAEGLRRLTSLQVGALSNLKPAYVHELCRSRKLPAIKSGKYWIVPITGLRRCLAYQNRDVDGDVDTLLQSLDVERPTPRCRQREGRRIVARH